MKYTLGLLKARTALNHDTGCWDWQRALSKDGYGHVRHEGRDKRAHRLVLELTVGPAPVGKPFALHSCDRACCINPKHLRWGSRDENTDDARERHRFAHGEHQHAAVLNSEAVRYIRANYVRGCREYGQKAMARKFSVAPSTVQSLLSGGTWQHVTQ